MWKNKRRQTEKKTLGHSFVHVKRKRGKAAAAKRLPLISSKIPIRGASSVLPHFAAQEVTRPKSPLPPIATHASTSATAPATVQLMSINMKLFWKGNARAVARDVNEDARQGRHWHRTRTESEARDKAENQARRRCPLRCCCCCCCWQRENCKAAA